MWFSTFLMVVATIWVGGLPSVCAQCTSPCVPGSEAIMDQKDHETSAQKDLKWGCRTALADRMCNFNRFYSERPGYWLQRKPFLKELKGKVEEGEKEVFYDSSTGKLLFTAPIDRSWEDWIQETRDHGWPSFRDNEVNWENVRVLPNGETVSVDGTHLGHNLPDREGNRYCINLVCIAGNAM